MHAADQVRVLLSKIGKRTIGERHHGCKVVMSSWVDSRIVADDGVESEAIKVSDQCFERRRCVAIPDCAIPAFVVSNGFGVVGCGLQSLCHRQHHAGEHRHRGRFEPERRGIGGDRVAMLRTADITTPADFNRKQANITHPFEVWPDRIRVQRKRFGDLGSGLGRQCSGKLKIDGVSRIVAQGFEQIKLRRKHESRLHGFGR